MSESDLVKTGIRGLDVILSDGIPRGNVTLLEGAIGCGKTTLGVEFVYRGATLFNEPGIIVLFEVSPHKLVRDAARFGWDIPALEVQRKLKIVFTSREVFRQQLQQAGSLFLEEAAQMGARRVFVDGVASGDGGLEGQSLATPFTPSSRRGSARTSRPSSQSKQARSATTGRSGGPRNRLPTRSSG